MRFVESVLVGVPLFWFLFFVVLISTGVDAYFLSETGEPVAGQFYSGTGTVSEVQNLSDITLRDEFGRQPLADVNESGILTVFSATQQGWGFISTMIKLEWNMLSLPLANVAGHDDREDISIFNALFWSLFVIPSHMLLIFAFLFFLRSG